MSDCCDHKGRELERLALQADQRRVLVVVLALNATMFFVEFGAGLIAGSAALMADSIDMLGDALVYGLSLYALARSPRWKAGAALAKGAFILALAGIVLVEIGIKLASGVPPLAPWMLGVGTLALAVNLVCFRLLWRFRDEDLNMASTFECSQNDLLANAGVLAAAAAVWLTGAAWPDIIVAALLAAVLLRSALRVLVRAWPEWRRPVRVGAGIPE